MYERDISSFFHQISEYSLVFPYRSVTNARTALVTIGRMLYR
jgi:hypothetical protein